MAGKMPDVSFYLVKMVATIVTIFSCMRGPKGQVGAKKVTVR